MGTAIYGGQVDVGAGVSGTITIRVDRDFTLRSLGFSAEGLATITDVDVLGQDNILHASTTYGISIQSLGANQGPVLLPSPALLPRGTSVVVTILDESAAANECGVTLIGTV